MGSATEAIRKAKEAQLVDEAPVNTGGSNALNAIRAAKGTTYTTAQTPQSMPSGRMPIQDFKPMTEELAAGQRAMLSMGDTYKQLQTRFGEDNVQPITYSEALSRSGKVASGPESQETAFIEYREDPTKEWRIYEPGMAGMAGPALKMAPIFASPFTGVMSLVPAIATEAGATLAAEGGAEYLRAKGAGDEADYTGAIGMAALSGAIPGAQRAVKGVSTYLKDVGNMKGALSGGEDVANFMSRAAKLDELSKANQMNIPGVTLMGPFGKNLFGTLRRQPVTENALDRMMFKFLDDNTKLFDNVVSSLGSQRPGRVQLAKNAIKTYDDSLEAAFSKLHKETGPMFEAVKADPKKISLDKFNKKLKELAASEEGLRTPGSEYEGPLKKYIQNTQTVSERNVLDDRGVFQTKVDVKPAEASITELQNMLRNWGNRAFGKENIPEYGPGAQSRRIAREAFGGLLDTVQEAADAGNKSAQGLLSTRARYSELLGNAKKIEDSVVGKLMDNIGSPSQLINKIESRSFQPEQLEEFFDVINDMNPGMANDFRAQFIKDMGSDIGGTVRMRIQDTPIRPGPEPMLEQQMISPANIWNKFAKNKEYISAVMSGATKEEKKALQNFIDQQELVARQIYSLVGSPTGTIAQYTEFGKSLMDSVVAGAQVPAKGALYLAAIMSPRALVPMLENPKYIKEFMDNGGLLSLMDTSKTNKVAWNVVEKIALGLGSTLDEILAGRVGQTVQRAAPEIIRGRQLESENRRTE